MKSLRAAASWVLISGGDREPWLVWYLVFLRGEWKSIFSSWADRACIYDLRSLVNNQWLCSHGLESRSKRRFGSRSKSWLGSWFELCAFTCIANAFPITLGICALRGNILLLLRSPRGLIDPCAHAWLQRAFLKCTRMNHVLEELCVHMF